MENLICIIFLYTFKLNVMMNNFQQLIVIFMCLFVLSLWKRSFKNDSTVKNGDNANVKNNGNVKIENNTTQALDLLPIPAVMLAQENPNQIEKGFIKTL
jgi:hypothetical protein